MSVGLACRLFLHRKHGGDHIHRKAEKKNYSDGAGEFSGEIRGCHIEYRRAEEEAHGKYHRFTLYLAGLYRNSDSRDKRGIADYRADGVSVRHTARSRHSALRGHHNLGKRRTDRNDGSTDKQLGKVELSRYTRCAVNEPISALDEHYKTDGKQKNIKPDHIFLLYFLAVRRKLCIKKAQYASAHIESGHLKQARLSP